MYFKSTKQVEILQFILRIFLLTTLFGFFISYEVEAKHYSKGAQNVFIAKDASMNTNELKKIAPYIEKSIKAGQFPGAVVLIGHRNKIVYQGVFGKRRIKPDVAPMTLDTIFDVASLTKVVATTPAIMQLIEQKKLKLNDRVSKFWPEFGSHGKNTITIRQLLTHTSGLPTGISPKSEKGALTTIEKLKPKHKPGKRYLYSDVNFVVLAEVVKRITHEPFADYVQTHIFKPLKMNHTSYLPSAKLRDSIAPTEIIAGKLRWGKVHDPIAYSMGGVAGNAGLFSTANDLAIYAEALLNKGQPLLKANTMTSMIKVQTPDHISKARGLGWDLAKSFINNKRHAFGHTGWTGTSLWIDPDSKTYIIILASRAHPVAKAKNPLIKTRKKIRNIVCASLAD